MMIKNQISLFIATFLIIGFFFVALPEDGFSGVAIPLPGPGDPRPPDPPGPGEPPGPVDPNPGPGPGPFPGPVPGPDPGLGLVGCCVFENMCMDDTTQEECADNPFFLFTDCSQVDLCPVIGCCITMPDGPACNVTTKDGCVTFMANVSCDGGSSGTSCSSLGEEGCCDGIPDNDTCLAGPEQNKSQCEITQGGRFTPGLDLECNTLTPPTCGEVGCCQEDVAEDGPAMCKESNNRDCDGLFVTGDTCTVNGFCESLIPGVVISPIPTLNQWGLIAMAGLLGIFSLFIIIRRHRYNLS